MKKFLVLLSVALLLAGSAIDAFAGDVEKALSQDISECGLIVKRIADGSMSGRPTADDIARLKSSAEAIHADRLLLGERHGAIADRAATLGSKTTDRQKAVSSSILSNLDDLLSRLDAIGDNVTPAELDSLKQLMDTLVPHKSRPLLGALPYKHTNYPPREPASTTVVKPAYKGGDRNVHAADTATTIEAPISKEIVDLAQSLQWNPVLIYEWLKNNVETEWYWGSMKGAEETLRQKSGNDADQATLLVALLRASGFPSRYIKGIIEFFPGIEKAKNLTGLDDPAKIATFFQKAGIPFKPVIAGGKIENFRIEHIWAESFIPYSNYRGTMVDDQGKIWLGLDTSIKPPGYTRTNGTDLPADLIGSLRDDYLASVQQITPLEYIKLKAGEYLAANQPGKEWNDLLDKKAIIPEVLKIIPSGLQFPQIAITGEYQTLPDELKHKVAFTATANNSELFSITLETHKLSNKRIALRAEPETVEDQNIIDSFGGLDNTPPYLVRLRPVLTLDGERLIVAQDGLPMGAEFALNMDIVTPNGSERVTSSHIAGNLSIISVVSQKAQTPALITEDDNAEAILYKEAIGYIDRWNSSEDELASLLGQRISRPTVAIVTAGGQIEVSSLLDMPHDFSWKGLFLDAGYRRVETVGGNGLELEFMRLSSLQGSILENRIFEDDLKVDSISTAKLLQLAQTNTTPVITVDKTNVDTVLPTLVFDDAVKADIANAVNQGLMVTMPQVEVAYQDWGGIGYVKENPETGESGWMLSGNVAGGMTAWSPAQWDIAALKAISDALRTPLSGKPNSNQQEAAYIAKIPITDQQIGIVGKPLTSALQVKVTDRTGRQVQGASVTFSVKAGNGILSNGKTAGATYVATTNLNGIASVTLTLGQLTSDNPIYWSTSGKIYSDQYGDNVVEAILGSTAASTTFNEYAAPGPLANLRPTHGMTTQGYSLSYSGFVGLMAEDLNGNPIANQKVTFKLGDPTVTGSCKTKITDMTKVTPALLVKAGDNCINSSPTISDAASCNMPSNSIDDTTSISGAWAGVILGGAPGATYPITATASASGKTFAAQYAPSTFDLINCSENVDPKAQLVVTSVIPNDIYGNNIDAGPSGSKVSIIAKQYLIKEGEATGTENLSCATGTLSCPKVVGNHSFATTTDFVTSTAKYNGVEANNLGNGLFHALYTLKPGLNTIKIEGTSTYGFNHASNSCTGCGAIGKDVRALGNSGTLQVYGVDIAIKQPLNIMLNDQGISRNNLKISFTINPATYQARDALILLYKVIEQSGKKTYEQIDYIPVEKKMGGFGTIARGYLFDETNNYVVSVVLNYGTSVQITSDPAPINFVDGVLIPDYNHNRQIDDEDFDQALNNDPYYFWVNDDDGNGDTEGTGIPESGADIDPPHLKVNGTRDLVDLFPVQLAFKNKLKKYDPAIYSYRLRNSDSALNYVVTDLGPTETGEYLTGENRGINFVQTMGSAPTLPITDTGFDSITASHLVLRPEVIEQIKLGKGVILIEGYKKTASPLVLEVYKGTSLVDSSLKLNLSIDGVEQMFRHVNLIQAIDAPNAPSLASGSGGEINRLFKDDFTNKDQFEGFDVQNDDKYFVLLHGVNVNGQAARGWHAELFKRLYWAGSKARFVGVSWYSTDGPSWGYYPNVVHAFETSEILGPKLKTVVGNSPVTIMAHSLGNMVVSSYLADQFQKPGNQLNVTSYLMFNAAVALEAYLGDYTGYGQLNEQLGPENTMVHSDWFGYQRRFSASEWHQHFAANDGRNELTWRNRFAALPESIKYVNFFSSGEDILATYSGTQPAPSDLISFDLSRNSWVLQEKWKGRPFGLAGSDYMGWAFNLNDDQYNPYLKGHLDSYDANLVITDNNQLITRPFFQKTAPTGVERVLFSDSFVDFSAIKTYFNSLLTYAMPALTTATGGWAGEEMISNKNFFITDMNLKKDNSTWPRREQTWNHSDIKDVAFPFVYKVIDELAIKGVLQ